MVPTPEGEPGWGAGLSFCSYFSATHLAKEILMATRMKLNPPTRPDGQDDPVTYTCETCGSTLVAQPEAHVRDGMHDRHIIFDLRMLSWYSDENKEKIHGTA